MRGRDAGRPQAEEDSLPDGLRGARALKDSRIRA